MKRVMRYAAIAVGIVVALVAAAFAVLVFSPDGEPLR